MRGADGTVTETVPALKVQEINATQLHQSFVESYRTSKRREREHNEPKPQ